MQDNSEQISFLSCVEKQNSK